jgi:Ca-activated chloride channel family protein
MEGVKLEQAQQAMLTFVDQIKGDQERVGLLTFSANVQETVPLDVLSVNRSELRSEISGLVARGDTALLDGVALAILKLADLGDTERINAVVVMTDGRENSSRARYNDLVQQIRLARDSGLPIVIFCVAYGDDADLSALESIAQASGGQVRQGDPESIRELYKLLSTYF